MCIIVIVNDVRSTTKVLDFSISCSRYKSASELNKTHSDLKELQDKWILSSTTISIWKAERRSKLREFYRNIPREKFSPKKITFPCALLKPDITSLTHIQLYPLVVWNPFVSTVQTGCFVNTVLLAHLLCCPYSEKSEWTQCPVQHSPEGFSSPPPHQNTHMCMHTYFQNF